MKIKIPKKKRLDERRRLLKKFLNLNTGRQFLEKKKFAKLERSVERTMGSKEAEIFRQKFHSKKK